MAFTGLLKLFFCYSRMFTGGMTSSFDMLCGLRNYVRKGKKVIVAKISHTGVLSGSDDIFHTEKKASVKPVTKKTRL